MNLVPDKKDFKKISPDVAGAYPPRLVERGYELVSTVRATEKSHFDVYGLVKRGKKVKVVYDVKAQMLSVTAFDDFIGEVCSILDAVRGGVKAALDRKATLDSANEDFNKDKSASNKVTGDGKLDFAKQDNNSVSKKQKDKTKTKKQPQSKPEQKLQPKPEQKPQPKPEQKVQPKPEQKPQPKPEQKVQPKPEQKVQPKPEQKVQPKPEQKPQPKPEQKVQPKPEQKVQPKPEQKPQPKPEQKGNFTSAQKSNQNKSKNNAKPDQKGSSTNAQKPKSSEGQNPTKKAETGSVKAEQNNNADKNGNVKSTSNSNEKQKLTPPKSPKPQQNKQREKDGVKQKEVKSENAKNEGKKVVSEAEKIEELPKSDFTLKKYTAERFDAVLDEIKALKIKIKQKQARGRNNGEMVRIYELSEGLKKLTVCFMADKGILQIQGKPCDFLSKIQTVFSESGDFKSAIGAHIEQKQTQNKASDVERQLKKYLPTGILYLSPQAKIDFSIGVIDLLVSDAILSDYSSLLIPPYRGLEMLIFDLQKAQGIKVKMIGQAFEKTPNGEYTLKASYRRRIGSVVFNEVMTALYVEYNSTRNFYVHSSLGQQTKVISDRNQARVIYERMLAVVEYNAKKLKEIHFSI